MTFHTRVALAGALLALLLSLAPRSADAACSAAGTVATVTDCIPSGKSSADCFLEWAVSPVPPADPKTGAPTANIVCTDNDPACDNDTTPGQCTFKVGVCLNVTDPRLTACIPEDVASVVVKKPSAKDTLKPSKNAFNFKNRQGLLASFSIAPSATGNVCSDLHSFVVPIKKNKTTKEKFQAQIVSAGGGKDSDKIAVACVPNPSIATQAISSAKQITSTSELIGGPMAMGRIGDYLIENDKARFIIRDAGRDYSFVLTYGGHLIDADLKRESGPGRDAFLAMTPLINISSTDYPQTVTVADDGSTGGPAVVQTVGPDDLLDPIDPWAAIEGFNTALEIPAPARDKNIDVSVMNEYSLTPGDDMLAIETIVENTGGTSLNLYLGEYAAGGGQLEFVAPGLGFGDSAIRLGGTGTGSTPIPYNYLGWVGFGESLGISYAIVPEYFNVTTSFAQSGVVVPVYRQNILNVLLGSQQPGTFTVAPAAMTSVRRWFVVSENGMGAVVDARNKLIARGDIAAGTPPKTGWIAGNVTAGGVPLDGARVAISAVPGNRSALRGLVSVFDTRDGFYQGTLPAGEYSVSVRAEGYPYEGGGTAPVFHPVKIGGGTKVVNVDLPATGFLQVDITDGVSSDPIAGKVSVVGVDTTPLSTITENAVLLEVVGNLHGYDVREKVVIHGLPRVQFAGPSGTTGAFAVPPGSYQVVVSHGPEYSVFKQNVTVTAGTPGAPQVIAASVVPVVDTTGFVSSDGHVHMINSPDSTVSKDERIITMLAEGVDHFVATDHDFVTLLDTEVAALGAASLIKTTPGAEMTYFDSGHFNAYPLDVIPGSVTNGALDWGRAGEPPGLGYPSDGSYDLSVEELGQLVKGAPHNATVFQANHFNSGTLGYFRLIGLDSTQPFPQSSTPPGILRQDPGITNLFSDEITALEIWIESSRDQNPLAIGENFGDWFNMLNSFGASQPTLRKAAVCDSDTHSTTIVQAGGPRTMVASATDDPSLIDSDLLANAINDGRSVCTSGPFMRVEVVGDGGQTARHALGNPLIVPATLGSATVNVSIQSPDWAEYDQIQFFVNTVPSCANAPTNFLGGTKNVCTPAPTFTQNLSPTATPVNGAIRLDASASQPLTITEDAWVVVMVRGRDGISKPLFPMNPQSIVPRACSGDPCRACTSNAGCAPFFGTCSVTNQTLAELTDGNLNQCGVTTLAFSNPLFIDFEGDGLYQGAAIP